MNSPQIDVQDGVGLLLIDSPPVNALGHSVRVMLRDGVGRLAADPSVRAIIIACGGRTFFAGADINEFGSAAKAPRLAEIFDAIENSPKPVIAAIHGSALGGGLELALTCHYRIAAPSAKVGLPEVKLGIIPGMGGTQRLTRIVGPETALDLVTSGKTIGARTAVELGVLDALADEARLTDDAIVFARKIVDQNMPLVRVRDRTDKTESPRPELFDTFSRKNARNFRGFKAPWSAIEAVRAATELPFDEGMAKERSLFLELENTIESRAQRYAFFAERQTAKIPDVPADTPVVPIASVGVIGAGTMGGGIAMCFLNANIPVTLVEMNQAALERGLSIIRSNYERTAKRGGLSEQDVETRMGLISAQVGLDALGDVDLVIEAVFEEMDVKKDIFHRLDSIAKPTAILASNTSFLDLNEIATATTRPESVIGLHFFSPANVMRLLEVVRGARTSQEVIATAMKLAKTIGKVPVLSGVCHGFIANRMMVRRSQQALALVLEGPTPTEIDKALYDYGFAMGPFAMSDLVGLDVTGRDETKRTLRGDLVKLGRLGQKQNRGFYDYDENRVARPSAVAAQVIADFAKFEGIENAGPQTAEQIVSRLLFPVVNEAARILEEGIALRASDIDIAAILGYNWPVYTGGPMFWADTVGLPRVFDELKLLEDKFGADFTPAPLLAKLAREGGSFTRR